MVELIPGVIAIADWIHPHAYRETPMTELTRAETIVGTNVRALQRGRLINPDLTLREIARAAEKIPGLGESGRASWELVTRDFVYKGLDADSALLDARQLTALEESRIVNFDITLGEIMGISASFADSAASRASWELVTRDFVLRGGSSIAELNQATKVTGR